MGVEINLEARTVKNTGTEAISIIEIMSKVTPIPAGETVTLDENTDVVRTP